MGKYKEKFRIRSYELDLNNRLFVSTLFDYLQQVASYHAEELGFGLEDIKEVGTYWVLARNHLKIHSYPKYGDTLTVETWPKGNHKSMSLRDFVIYNSDGDVIGEATSSWLLMDLKRNRPVRPPKEIKGVVEEHVIAEVPGKIKDYEVADRVFTHKVGYSDCDVNGHVNNVNYIRWIQNAFSINKYSNEEVRDIQVNFLCECHIDDEIDMYMTEIDKNIWFVEGYNKTMDKKAFKSIIKWTDR